MDPIDPHPDSPEQGDDALDALLAQARWPEADAASTRRLAAAWAGVSPARNDRGRRYLLLAAAAALVIVSGIVAAIVLRPGRPDPIRRVQDVPRAEPVDVSAEKPHSTPVLFVAGSREPTARERLLMCDGSSRRRFGAVVQNVATVQPPTGPVHVTARGPLRRPQTPSPTPVESVPGDRYATVRLDTPESLQAFLARVANVRTRAAALASLDGMSNPPIEALLNELSNRRAELRYAAARALGRINGPVTTSALLDLVEQDVRRREAVAALLCCAKDPNAAAFLAEARESRRLGPLVRSAEIQLNHF